MVVFIVKGEPAFGQSSPFYNPNPPIKYGGKLPVTPKFEDKSNKNQNILPNYGDSVRKIARYYMTPDKAPVITRYSYAFEYASSINTNNNVNGPSYKMGASIEDRMKANFDYIQKQDKQQQIRYEELAKALNELKQESVTPNKPTNINPYTSPEFLSATKSYTTALQNLKDMLAGKQKTSVADAYFTIENAYGETYLSKKEFGGVIKESADFIKKWMVQNGLNPASNASVHLAIQRFMGDTLTITSKSVEGKTITKKHFPYTYDFDDFKGERDFRNYFSTKCLATGSGQCNSMPVVYLALAEALGVKAYLTFAPYHSFVKYPADGMIHSYEPTSNWSITDEWYMEHMFISDIAVQKGTYLDTLNSKQIVADCVIDLAWGYMQKFGPADGKFVKECLNTALPYFPKENNIYAYFVFSDYMLRKLEVLMRKHKITRFEDVKKIPEGKKLYDAMLQNEQTITELGWQDQPKELYDRIMEEQEFKGRRQACTGFDTKQKRSLFSTTIK
ncbi:MAG TPA: hypothetical protein VD905_20790 [Flavobacteriales bacterium]|nr:hypothetical protein [Flavobacteriales bacterium]